MSKTTDLEIAKYLAGHLAYNMIPVELVIAPHSGEPTRSTIVVEVGRMNVYVENERFSIIEYGIKTETRTTKEPLRTLDEVVDWIRNPS